MTLELVALGWKYPADTAAERLILLKICDEANSQGQSIYFAMETYARVGLLTSTRGAQKILRRLEEKGIIEDDPDFEAKLRKEGKFVRARVLRLNIRNMKAAIEAARPDDIAIDAFRKRDAEHELSSPPTGRSESELSSCSGDDLTPNSVRVKDELSSPYPFLESFTDNPHSPLVQDFTEDFERLWTAWTPFEMLHGDRGPAERKYAKIRNEGVSADRILAAARVYCQQCRNTRCKTKHIENWLGQCVWKPEGKGLGGDGSGKSTEKKPASLYVVIDAAGVELAQWWPHGVPSKGRIESEYPGCRLRLRDATAQEIAELHSATGENDDDKNQVTA
jgi:hypothetical protein